MVRVIMALQGHGKTKQIIELANQAAKDEHNTVVFIERGNKLTYDVSHRARLIDISIYRIEGFGQLKTFICGLYSGNFDISEVFIDSLFKVAGSNSIEETESFLIWLEEFGEENGINFTVTISEDTNKATERIKNYFVKA
ncbi:MAG: hypothetical protein GX541_06580 [Clostridiales bacterium]|nr:hypothetical protein [Clostridiales bacterium]